MSYVYFVQSVNGGPVKIGWAKDPQARLPELQCGSPVELTIRAVLPGSLALERDLHRRFAPHRKHGEWFVPTPEIEHVAGVDLRAHGTVLRQEDGGLPGPAYGCLRERHARVFWAYARADGWASPSYMTTLGWLSSGETRGATTWLLRTGRYLVARTALSWEQSRYTRRTISTRQYAPWWLADEDRPPRSARPRRQRVRREFPDARYEAVTA